MKGRARRLMTRLLAVAAAMAAVGAAATLSRRR